MLSNPFKLLKKREWIILICSLSIVVISNFLSGQINVLTFSATVLGVIGLIFLAIGNVWGQIICIIFSVLYAINAFNFRYYGEMITYLGMTLPISVMSVVTWLKNPSDSGKDVKIRGLKKTEWFLVILSAVIVTTGGYYLLAYLNTPNLFWSTLSITTSYLAALLMMLRNSWYAIAYCGNDIILIVLWILASIEDIRYLPMIFCFLAFLFNDFYGFISWKKREKNQVVE